jgi:hypothetical protein
VAVSWRPGFSRAGRGVTQDTQGFPSGGIPPQLHGISQRGSRVLGRCISDALLWDWLFQQRKSGKS